MKLTIILTIASLLISVGTQAQVTAKNFEELMDYAQGKSVTVKNTGIKLTQARHGKIAAGLSILNPTGNISGSYIDNNKLPVNLFPAEIFGGKPGTFQAIKLGLRYQTSFNSDVDLKLLNIPGWQDLKLAKINISLTAYENQLDLKSIFEKAAEAYYNIIALQEELQSNGFNRSAADTLLQITTNLYNQGQVKQQDVNDSKVNLLNVQQSIDQLKYKITQQVIALKIICDIPEQDSLIIKQTVIPEDSFENISAAPGKLNIDHAFAKEQYAAVYYRQALYQNLPTVSLVSSMTSQQYNNSARLFDSHTNWLSSSYIGVKINIPLPGSSTISRYYKAKYDYLLEKNNAQQAEIKAGLDRVQLNTSLEKAKAKFKQDQEIYEINRDTYTKNLLNYKAGVIGLNKTIDSFTNMVNSNFERISSQITALLAATYISINNKFSK